MSDRPGGRGGDRELHDGRMSAPVVEPAAEGEIEIDALHELLALHAEERRARAIQRDLLLLHCAQIARAHPVPHVGKLQRALGWRPRYTDLAEIVATAWEFEKRHHAVKV